MGVVRFAKKKIMLPRPSLHSHCSPGARRKLLCEAVWLAGFKTEEWQKEISIEEPLG